MVVQALTAAVAGHDIVTGPVATIFACQDVVPSQLATCVAPVLSLVLLCLALGTVDLLAEEVGLQVPVGPGEALDLLGGLDGEKRGGDGDDGALHKKRSFPAHYGQIGF